MSMEGNCCLEIDNSGCLRGFNVKNSCYVLFVKNLFAQPRPQGFSRPTHFLREKPWGRGCRDIVYSGNIGEIAPIRTANGALF